MDTCIVNRKNSKMIVLAINTSIIVGALLIPSILKGVPLLASEQLTIANSAIISPLLQSTKLEKNIKEKLTTEQQIKNFDENIKRKYRAGTIINVDTGVKRIKLVKTYKGKPVRINVIEVNRDLNPNLELTPSLASNSLARKSTITTIAKNNNSIVAINGTFFKPQTGVPLGTLMINKKMYTGPIYNRVAMGIFDNGYDMARVQLNATLKSRRELVKIDNINQPRMLSTYMIVYTSDWGAKAPISPKYGKQLVVSDNRVQQISANPLNIPKEGYVVVGPAKQIEKFKVGDAVNLDIKTIPDWDNVNHIISGGPYLVKKGNVFVDTAEEKLGSIGGRNPRTAVGYTADNHFVIVIVDGREASSIGITLNELAQFMKSIGCYNAMNLDGGGSTVLYVNGKVVNNPKVKGGIALSNALTINKV